jgi:hypothetical protein
MRVLLISMLAVGCASSPYKVEKLEGAFESKGYAGSKMIAINEKGEAVTKEEKLVASEVSVLKHVNENLRLELQYHDYLWKECRVELSKGSGGDYPEFSEELQLQQAGFKEELGLSKDELVIRKTSYVKDELSSLRVEEEQLRRLIGAKKVSAKKCQFEKSKI